MGLIDIGYLPNLDIFGIFTCHFGFATWALLDGLSLGSLFYNNIFLMVLLWCVKEKQTEVPLILAIRVNIVCAIFDIWYIFGHYSYSIIGLWIFLGKVLNFFLRFITIPLLSKMCSDKTGGINDGLPQPLVPIFGVDQVIVRDPYENIDSIPHQSYPNSEPVIGPTGSYSFTSNAPNYQAQA